MSIPGKTRISALVAKQRNGNLAIYDGQVVGIILIDLKSSSIVRRVVQLALDQLQCILFGNLRHALGELLLAGADALAVNQYFVIDLDHGKLDGDDQALLAGLFVFDKGERVRVAAVNRHIGAAVILGAVLLGQIQSQIDVALYKVDCNARQSLVENLVIGFAIINAAHDHQLNIIKPGAASQHRSTGGGNRSSASQLQERTARNRAHKNPSKIKSIHPKCRRSLLHTEYRRIKRFATEVFTLCI